MRFGVAPGRMVKCRTQPHVPTSSRRRAPTSDRSFSRRKRNGRTPTIFPDGTNALQRINRNGQTLNYTYNALNWMTQKVSPSPAVTASWAYLLDGRVDVLSDTTGSNDSIDYGYDTAGRMKSVTTFQPDFGGHRIVNYTLDANGNRTKLTWPTIDGGDFAGYCYDSLNRMVMAQDNATDCASGPLATYAYDAQSRRTNVTYGNGASMSYPSYTDAGDLQTLAHTFPGGTGNNNTFSYTYTNAHQTNTIAASNAAFFSQPPLNNSTSCTVNNLNQYPTIGTQTTGGTDCFGHAQGLSYDCNGNLTFDGIFTYTYDAENRLLTANNTAGGTVAASYLYDPLGRRTKKSGTGVTTTYFLNDGTDEIAEYDSTKTITRRIIPGPAIDEPIAIVAMPSETKEYLHTDKQGSVVAMSDAGGNLIEGPYTYDGWGNCFVSLTACSATGEPYRFTGRRFDPETGLYYYRARYYCPRDNCGVRFLQTDPVGYTADLNLYTYGGNDPTDRLDPTGFCDDLTGCNPALAQQENDPMTQSAEQVTMAVGAPVTIGIGVAVAAGPVTIVGTIAISGGVGGTVTAAHSAAQGNSPARVAADAARGTATSAVTAAAGKVGGIAGGAGTVSGEMTGAYAGTKAVGGSDTDATISAVVSGAVGTLALPLGTSTSSEAAAITSQVIKSFVKSEVKTDARKKISTMPSGCSKSSNNSGCSRQR
jgi:RHS repeat-associated protein